MDTLYEHIDLDAVLSSGGILTDYYNQIMPAGYYARVLASPESSEKKVGRARSMLPSVLSGIPSYSAYLDGELKSSDVLRTRLRERLGDSKPAAIETLDGIVAELHSYAGKSAEQGAPLAVEELVERARQVIYQ